MNSIDSFTKVKKDWEKKVKIRHGKKIKIRWNDISEMQTLEYGRLSTPQQYPHATILAEPRSPRHAFRKNQLPIVPHLLNLSE